MAEVIEHGDYTIFGGVNVVHNGVATAIAVAGTYVQVTVFTADSPSRGCTPAHGTDDITIIVPGIYLVQFSIDLEVTQNDVVHVEARKNNGVTVLDNIHGGMTGAGAGLLQSTNGADVVALVAGDTVELWIANDTSTDNMTIDCASLTVLRVGA